ncbi:patatin-like phospholipase family protein [Chromobacterium haemolyticum]|nr:patatin-like phospholipase family protein [Chromobacterium haemolyticum]
MGSFDQLPIPFRAVATDLATGEPVVFSQGSLARALRASMAVPGLFDLIEDDDGRLLVDGGLARNLPIQDVKGRCADRVIVVDVSTPLMKAKEINSLFDVVAQTSNLMVSRNAKEQLRKLDKRDLVIKPDLSGYTSASFSEHQAITQRGEEAAKALAKQLSAYSVSEEEYAAWKRRLVRPHFPLIDKIQVEGKPGQFTKPEQLAKSLAFSSVVEPISSAQSRLRGVFAGGDYDRLTYRVDNVSGRNVMTVSPLERSIGPNFLRFGLNLNSATPGESNFNFLASHEWRNANSAGGAWRNDASIGQNKLFKTEWYQPLYEGSPVFGAVSLGYRQDFLPIYNADHSLNTEWNNDVGSVRLDGGVALGQYGEWRIGAYRDDNHFGSRVSWFPGFVPPNFRDTGVGTSLIVDQFDNPRWPRSGYFFSGRLTKSIPSWGSDVNLTSYNTTLEYAKTLGSITIRLSAKNKGALNLKDREDAQTLPRSLGGFLNLSGYQESELIGDRSSLFRSMLYWRASSLPSAIGSGVYAGISMELGKIWGRVRAEDLTSQDTNWIPAGSVFLAADTIIGPFFVGVGTARGGKPTAYLYLGSDY